MDHGIQIYDGNDSTWIFIQADDRELADKLQAATAARGLVPSRRVMRQDDGSFVTISATE